MADKYLKTLDFGNGDKYHPLPLLGGDGKTWMQSNQTGIDIAQMRYENGIWVAYGGDSGIYYSTDGKAWTFSNQYANGGNTGVPGYGNGIWVLGGYYSTDGKTWTETNPSYINTAYYANDLWIASGNGINYSEDGKTWTESNVGYGRYTAFCYANGFWICGSNMAQNRGIYYSINGKTWTKSNITTGDFISSCYANNLWLVGSYNGNGIYYSEDGKIWTQSSLTNDKIWSIVYANDLWIAGGSNGFYSSLNGRTWNVIDVANKSDNPAVYYANGLWVIGSYSAGAYYSTDGKTWAQSNIKSDITKVGYGNGIWVAGSQQNGLYYSEASEGQVLQVVNGEWTPSQLDIPDANDFVPTTRTVNGKQLLSDITLYAGDVGSVPGIWTTSKDGKVDTLEFTGNVHGGSVILGYNLEDDIWTYGDYSSNSYISTKFNGEIEVSKEPTTSMGIVNKNYLETFVNSRNIFVVDIVVDNNNNNKLTLDKTFDEIFDAFNSHIRIVGFMRDKNSSDYNYEIFGIDSIEEDWIFMNSILSRDNFISLHTIQIKNDNSAQLTVKSILCADVTNGSPSFNAYSLQISEVGDPTSDNDAVPKHYVDTAIESTQPTILTAILQPGSPTVTFQNPKITTSSIIDFYASKWGVNITNVVVETGKIAVTYEEPSSAVVVRAEVR